MSRHNASMDEPIPPPLVYACSGPSRAAQFAHQLALELHGRSLAEMSCIAGIGGDVPHLVKLARSGRPIIAIDGCPLGCVKCSLSSVGLMPVRHYQLQHHWVKDREHEHFDAANAAGVAERIRRDLTGTALIPPRAVQR